MNLHAVCFFDIECVPLANWEDIGETLQDLWRSKFNKKGDLTEEEVAQLFTDTAAFYAEFSKVVCVSVYFNKVLKSFYGPEEKLLADLSEYFRTNQVGYLCGHNIKGYDVPFLCRRYLLNGLPIPKVLNVTGKKPWEMNFLIDTMEFWKFGSFKYNASLDLLCAAFGLPSPKSEMDGSQVFGKYQEGDFEAIARYCEEDVKSCVRLYKTIKDIR